MPGRHLSSPALELITLNGHWSIEAKVLEVLCLIVAPNLCEMDFGSSCVGFTLKEWVTLARRMLKMGQSCLRQRFANDEIKELGLLSIDELPDEDLTERYIRHGLHGRTYWDILDT
jgi:hypothetical protein